MEQDRQKENEKVGGHRSRDLRRKGMSRRWIWLDYLHRSGDLPVYHHGYSQQLWDFIHLLDEGFKG